MAQRVYRGFKVAIRGPVGQPAQVLLLAPPEARMATPQYLSPFASLFAACRIAVLQAKAKHRDKPRIKGCGASGSGELTISVVLLSTRERRALTATPSCLAVSLPADIISTVEFNHTGELLATGDKGGRVVIFQREPESKNAPHSQGEYDVYSTFQSHEPEFDYLKSLEIEEKINKIKWLPQQNAAHSLLSTNDKTIKLWKITERDKRPEGYNLKDEEGKLKDLSTVTSLQVPVLKPMDLMVEVSPRRIFANGHTYHINSISVNSDCETYMSADDLRINLWHLAITDRSFNIVDIKPANMEDLTEVITASEFHPHHCNLFVYSSSKGSLRLCDMRAAALCDKHSKLFEEPEDPSNRSFFSEIISSVSDVKFSHSGRYMLTRDYLTVKVWDLNMEARPIETYQVHDYLRSKLCSLYENDCIFDKFECAWNGSDSGPQEGLFKSEERNLQLLCILGDRRGCRIVAARWTLQRGFPAPAERGWAARCGEAAALLLDSLSFWSTFYPSPPCA
ncbi:hypothetical protein H8959_001523 [Pygathrix nigripes]